MIDRIKIIGRGITIVSGVLSILTIFGKWFDFSRVINMVQQLGWDFGLESRFSLFSMIGAAGDFEDIVGSTGDFDTYKAILIMLIIFAFIMLALELFGAFSDSLNLFGYSIGAFAATGLLSSVCIGAVYYINRSIAEEMYDFTGGFSFKLVQTTKLPWILILLGVIAVLGAWINTNAPSIARRLAGHTVKTNKQACPNCGALQKTGSRFCAECGAEMFATKQKKLFCPYCGVEQDPGSVFCSECGKKIE